MSAGNLIEVSSLHRFYGDNHAVDGVSFVLRRGEVLGFLGPNGAGKTSTMQMVCGVLAPSAGAVAIAGHDLLETPRRAKAHLGYLPDHPPLYRELSVDEYLAFCGRLHGLRGATLREAMGDARARCGLEAVARRLLGNLSRGYQQRVGIAQAILHRPAAVILDEPTVGLDPNQIRDVRALIRELSAECGVLLSTHVLSEVEAVCDRVQIMHLGRLVWEGSLADAGDGEGPRLESLFASLTRGHDADPAPRGLAGPA